MVRNGINYVFLLFRSFGIYLAKYAAKMKQMSAKPHDRIPFQRTSNPKPTNRIIMLKSKKVSVKYRFMISTSIIKGGYYSPLHLYYAIRHASVQPSSLPSNITFCKEHP